MCLIRDLRDEERAFVLSSWLKSYRNAPHMRLVDNDTYYAKQAANIIAMLDCSQCLVAADPEEDTVLWGFIVVEYDYCHYAYVKHLMRHHGIARSLWHAAGKPQWASALTHAGEAIFRKHKNVLRFDPFAVQSLRQ